MHQPGNAPSESGGGDDGDDDPSTDPAAKKPLTHVFDERDYAGHRAHTVYAAAAAAATDGGCGKRGRRKHRPHPRDAAPNPTRPMFRGRRLSVTDDGETLTPPAQRVQRILGTGDESAAHPLFSEMEELVGQEWRETARWVKFEEDVEVGGGRWSKPHVATLSLHSLLELRSLLLRGAVLLDVRASSLDQVADVVLQHAPHVPPASAARLRTALLRRHRHQHEQRLPLVRRNHGADGATEDDGDEDEPHRANEPFMRKIPAGAEASNVLVGAVDFLEDALAAFVRLETAVELGDLTEVPVPTRFLFLLLGPPSATSYREIGRAMATLMSDDIFHEVAYRARHREHLLAGVDEFLDAVTVLPPGEWDPTIRIEPPPAIPTRLPRPPEPSQDDESSSCDEREEREESERRARSGLTRTGRLFGGLVDDLRRKLPWYTSDFTDALALQCVASWIFLYFACLSPIITFGGLLGEATGRNMAAMESLVSGLVCGVGYGLFSGQPLTILGSTGPVLVFETIVFEFCKRIGWNYMSFRFCIGTWIAVILVVLVAVDASALVCYITRFTEENFATLIAFIFIYKAIENVASIGRKFPVARGQHAVLQVCSCLPAAGVSPPPNVDWNTLNTTECMVYNGTLAGDCDEPEYVADVFLMSIILFVGTFTISIILKDFKNSLFFSSKVRQTISDFAVTIAIISMSALDWWAGIGTPKLEVPGELKPTLDGRGWLIAPLATNPAWSAAAALPPALLGTILVFMDQQISAVIVNRKENLLRKGCGYHLDLFVLAVLIQICSVFGLPWFVAATVLSINHVDSLRLESESAAPGEVRRFLGVREQRVTHVLIFLTIGCSVLLAPALRRIPMPVLFGVFLYMGVASLRGLQLFDRLLLAFMPQKHQPDRLFLRRVPLARVHLFTLIQILCLAGLWIVKSFSTTSILFPLMLLIMIGVRRALDAIFTRRELRILDDLMPGSARPPPPREGGDNALAPLVNGKAKSPLSAINISEEVNKTGIWRQLSRARLKRKWSDQRSPTTCKTWGSALKSGGVETTV